MPRTDWHDETWSEVVDTLREHMESLGFNVHTNSAMRTLTITAGGKALSLMDISDSHFTGGSNPSDPVVVHLHG